MAADNLDIPLENFPGYIEQLKAEKDSLIDQIQQIKLEEKLALDGYHTTKRKLEEYWNDRPLFEKNQQLKQKLEEANQKRDIYKTELEQVKFWERKKENMMWVIPEDELSKAEGYELFKASDKSRKSKKYSDGCFFPSQ